jgi:hypothetical protein
LQRLALGIAGFFGLGATARARPSNRPQTPQFEAPPPLVELTKEQMRSAWEDLADPSKAQATVQLLAAGKQTVLLLSEHMKPAAALPGSDRIDRLIKDLQDTRFATRQAATAELEKLGPAAEPALRKVLESQPPLEVSRRIEAVFARWPILQAQFSNGLRALALQASPDALALLAALSKGHAAAWQTSAATAACELLRTACWHMLVYGPARAHMEADEELLKQYWLDLQKRPPNAR